MLFFHNMLDFMGANAAVTSSSVHLAKELLLETELRCALGVFGIHGVPP